MDLQRIKHLAGIKLNESVMAVPGIGISEDESDMQTAGTVGRDSAYASFDQSQGPATESCEMDESWPAPGSFSNMNAEGYEDVMKAAKRFLYNRYGQKNMKPEEAVDTATHSLGYTMDALDEFESANPHYVVHMKNRYLQDPYPQPAKIRETAPPGMEDTVMKLKKEYPGDESKAFATAWSIYNKKHGKTEEGMEEGAEDGFSNKPPTSREAQAMQQRFNDEKWKRHAEDEARLAKEFPTPPKPQEEGCTMEENTERSEEIGRAVEHFVNMVTHSFADPDTAYDRIVQDMDDATIQEFNDALEAEGLMSQDDEDSFDDSMDGDFDSAMASAGHGSDEDYGHFGGEEFEEAYDFNNGYNDIHDATGDDYFPDGADSPVVSDTGPSGARQGDNPEQKKMQVDEVHKELVYGYRNYLKESKKPK